MRQGLACTLQVITACTRTQVAVAAEPLPDTSRPVQRVCSSAHFAKEHVLMHLPKHPLMKV